MSMVVASGGPELGCKVTNGPRGVVVGAGVGCRIGFRTLGMEAGVTATSKPTCGVGRGVGVARGATAGEGAA